MIDEKIDDIVGKRRYNLTKNWLLVGMEVDNVINLSSYCPSLERVQGEEIKNMLKLMTLYLKG